MTPFEAVLAMWFVLKFGERWRWVLAMFVIAAWTMPHFNLVYEAIVPVQSDVDHDHREIGVMA